MRGAALAAVVIAMAAPASAGAAPLSPSAQFAYNVASGSRGGVEGCDVQMVPAFVQPDAVAEYSAAPCFIYVSRSLAGSAQFAKTCKVLVSILAGFHGEAFPSRLPAVCIDHEQFLLNHPDYLRKRFN